MGGKSEEAELEADVTEPLRDRPLSLSDLTRPAATAATAPTRVRGTMVWFNVEHDVGLLRTDAGERIDVPGTAFSPGEKPAGRCAGREVEFESLDGAISGVCFVPEPERRRARLRRRG